MRSDTFIREKPVKLLLSLQGAEQANTPNTIIGLANASGMSFVHASNLLNELEGAGIVSSSKSGRTKRMVLTPKGAELANALHALMETLNPPPAAQPERPPAPLQSEPLTEFPQPPEPPKTKASPAEEEPKENKE